MDSLADVQSPPHARGATASSEGGIYSRERHRSWLQSIGIARLCVLVFVSVGTALMRFEDGAGILLSAYVLGFLVSLSYLSMLQSGRRISRILSWAQVLVDFGVVALTVAYTHGPSSFFTFIFVAVVLEAGVLLGLSPSFFIASLASVFMLQQIVWHAPESRVFSNFERWYNFLVQCLAFYLTAFISGYWTQRLYRLQEFQREILDNMNSGFLITDAEGRVSVQNNAAQQILGLDRDRAAGLPVSEVLRVEDGAECPVLTALRSGQDFTSYEFRVVREDGESILLGLTTNCITEPTGEITGVIASFSDLTEMNAMREELRRHDRLAVVGELAAGLAHEIRNPVAVIRGSLEELSRVEKDSVLDAKLRHMAIRESDHLNDIVAGFLDFAREPSVKREKFDVCALALEVGEQTRSEYLGDAGLRVDLDIPDHPVWVSGDASKIKQVFTNLAKNAAEAMEGRGTLGIAVTPTAGPVEIRFDDEGQGIAPDKIGRIFEPFYTTKDTGVGMGLAVCMRIITAHDGTIRVSSREGRGSSMRVLLPAIRKGKE